MDRAEVIASTLAAGLLAFGLWACSGLAFSQARRERAVAAVSGWSAGSQLGAENLLDKYGPPDEIADTELRWDDKGRWKTLRIWNVDSAGLSGVGPDNIEGTVVVPVPGDKRAELAEFSDKVSVSEDGLRFSVRGASEGVDFLLANLAYEVIKGSRDPAAARAFYERTVRASFAGKSSSYMRRLKFSGLRFSGTPAGAGQLGSD